MSRRADLSHDNDISAAGLYHLHSKAMLAYVRSRLSSQQEAEDIVVDVFLVALENQLFSRLGEQAQAAWLRRVAQRKIADYYRATSHGPNINIDDVVDTLADGASPEDEVLRGEIQVALWSAIALLSQEQQTVLRLRFAEGLRCTEIARYLGKQEDAVRKILSRTLNQLRTLYTSH